MRWADVGSKLVPVGLGQVLPNLLMLGLLQVVGGGVLQVGLHLGKGKAQLWRGLGLLYRSRTEEEAEALPSVPPQAQEEATGSARGC